MAKLKKPSKRQPARQRYKIQKRIRAHNRKVRKEAKKNPKSKKKEIIQVPNICPFKEDILKEAEAAKKRVEEERKERREQAKLEKQQQTLESLVGNAEMRGKLHENFETLVEEREEKGSTENSLKAFYKEFKKVIQAADVILEVVDARDPLGTRCEQVEQSVNDSGKRLVIILNKSDLVPRKIVDQWLKYLKRFTPVVAFKASTQDQSKKLGQRKFTKAEKTTKGSSAVGVELIMSLLANYCRNKGVKTSITVGVVGLPNVGKSSIINSLKRSRACNVGATPGVTKAMQEVQLDSKIKLLDSPGIVFAVGNDESASLRNAVKISTLSDPVKPANAILQRVGKQQMMEMYDITEYNSPDEFYTLKAKRMGRVKRGGVPDILAAARGLLEDWNSGKIKYYTVPPEDDPNKVHVSSAIVSEIAKEFDLDSFEAMETENLSKLEKEADKDEEFLVVESLKAQQMETDEVKSLLSDKINIETKKKSKNKETVETTKTNTNPEMELEGNQQLNKLKKKQFKKEKKLRNRRDKVAQQLSTGLENFNLTENYDFKDFDMQD